MRDRILDLVRPHLREVVAPFDPGAPPPDALRLDLNEGAYGPTPSALAAIDAAAPRLNRYPDPAARELRQRLAEEHDVDPSMILFGSGSNAVSSVLLRCAAGPGDAVAYSWPGFPTYGMTASRIGARPLPVPVLPDGSDDLDALAVAAQRAAVVALATPANPTGRQVMDGLAAFVERASADALVIVDEAYHEYARAAPSGMDFVRAGLPIVCTRTFSKAWGLAGARIGYGVMPAELAAIARASQDTFEVSSLAFAAALGALDDRAEVDRRTAENARVRDALEASFLASGLEYYPSSANFVLVRPDDPRGFAAALAERGIIVRVTSAFGDATRVRIGVPAAADLDRVRGAVEDVLR